MIKTKPIQYTRLNDGRWKAKEKSSIFGDHIAYGDSRDEAEQKLRSSLKSHAYSITHRARGHFG